MSRFCTCLLLLSLAKPELVWANEPQFERDVRPVLLAHCFKCHGLETRKAGLDLRTRSLMLRGGDNGPALQLKDLKASLIYKHVVSRNMPPAGELDLTGVQVGIIRRWVEEGAPARESNDPEPASDALLVSDEDRKF